MIGKYLMPKPLELEQETTGQLQTKRYDCGQGRIKMNELKHFNAAMQYIEDNLAEEIDYEKLGQIATCPAGLFSRIFPIFSNMSLGEYIRLRRLSKAAFELQTEQRKVIDVAMEYGYDSVDAFTVAFRRLFNKTPSEIKRGAPFRIVPPIQFSIHIQGGTAMDVKIEKKEAFTIAGLAMRANADSDFSGLWDQLFDKYQIKDLASMGTGQSFGSCSQMEPDGTFTYMAAFDCKVMNAARQMGLQVLEIPAATYAVVRLVGPVPHNIHKGWEYVMGVFLPQQGYRHSGSSDFEFYSDGDMSAPDYQMELWVPVEKA